MRSLVLAVGLAFVAGLPAQSPSWSVFGSGCGPALSVVQPPAIGQPFELSLSNAPPLRAAFVDLGVSNQVWGPLSLPFDLSSAGMPGCTLYASAEVMTFVATDGNGHARYALIVPDNPFLLGKVFYNQAFVFDPGANAAGLVASDAGRGMIGATPAVVEDFNNASQLDKARSSGTWAGGVATPGQVGDDGLLGDFDYTLGTQTSPGVYEWPTDSIVIPSAQTLSGNDETVTNGVFRFASFTIPSGVTVRFVGSKPARIYVRGEARIDGTLDLSGVTPDAPDGSNPIGQLGGDGGAGGGRGGNGGDAGDGLGAQSRFDGQDGDDVQVPAGHAYASQAIGTGGQGSQQFPADGRNSSVLLSFFGTVSLQSAAGGGGGGFSSMGQPGHGVTSYQNLPMLLGPPAAGGNAFGLFPLLAPLPGHFVVGGSGGGGAGSDPYRSTTPIRWLSGGAGGGGGGALLLRPGGDLVMSSSGTIDLQGGSTEVDLTFSYAAPGGAGSGGSALLQVGGQPSLQGRIDVRGGSGAVFLDNAMFRTQVVGGDGSAGYLRLETPGTPQPSALGTTQPAYASTSNTVTVAPLTERDLAVGQQSQWYVATQSQTTWLRYQVDAHVNGQLVHFSDDPALGPLAVAGQAVRFYVQGAQVDAQGNVNEATATPWRTLVGASAGQPTLEDDHAQAVRFVLVFDRAIAPVIDVTRVAVFHR